MAELLRRIAIVALVLGVCTLAGAAIGASAAHYLKETLP